MKERIRVAVLITRLHWGGAEKLLYDVLHRNQLQDTGVDYFLYALEPGNLEEDFRQLGYPVVVLGQRNRVDFSVIPRLAAELKRQRIDLLHSHLPRAGIVGRLAAKVAHVPSIYTEHNLWTRYSWQSRYLHLATLPMERQIIAVSKAVQSRILRLHPWLRHKTTVVVNGVNFLSFQDYIGNRQDIRQEFGLGINEQIIINVANLHPKKAQIDLIRAFELVRTAHQSSVSLIIVGRDDGEGKALRRLIQELGLTSNVILTGPRNDVPRLMAGADIFVLSSVVEGLPVTLLEASALALPAVVTSVGGIPEVIVDGENGWLVPPRDPKALAQALLEALQNRDEAKRRGLAARKLIQERYSIERMIERYTDLYREVLQNTCYD